MCLSGVAALFCLVCMGCTSSLICVCVCYIPTEHTIIIAVGSIFRFRTQHNTEPHAIAIQEFQAEQPDELNVHVGDTVMLLDEIDAAWLKGEVHGHVGLFPRDFVEIKIPLPAKTSIDIKDKMQSSSVKQIDSPAVAPAHTGLAKAEYDYESDAAGDLVFVAGEEIVLDERVNAEWFRGHIGSRTGMFPAAFVTVLHDL
jgi:SH3 domain-containing protein 19